MTQAAAQTAIGQPNAIAMAFFFVLSVRTTTSFGPVTAARIGPWSVAAWAMRRTARPCGSSVTGASGTIFGSIRRLPAT